MKRCDTCESWNGSIFQPRCNCFGVAIRSDAEGMLYVLDQCRRHQEYRDTIERNTAPQPRFIALFDRLCGVPGWVKKLNYPR